MNHRRLKAYDFASYYESPNGLPRLALYLINTALKAGFMGYMY